VGEAHFGPSWLMGDPEPRPAATYKTIKANHIVPEIPETVYDDFSQLTPYDDDYSQVTEEHYS